MKISLNPDFYRRSKSLNKANQRAKLGVSWSAKLFRGMQKFNLNSYLLGIWNGHRQ